MTEIERLQSRITELEEKYDLALSSLKEIVPGETESYDYWVKRLHHGGFVIRRGEP